MIYLSYDLETTGLDTSRCAIVEVGWVIWDSQRGVPLSIYSGLVRQDAPIPTAATDIHGITDQDVADAPPLAVHLQALAADVEKWLPIRRLGHNIRSYDDVILSRLTPGIHPALSLSPLDTKTDVPKWRGRKLVHALAEFGGRVNPFAHRAVFDALSVCLLMQHGGVAIEDICRRLDAPQVLFQSTQGRDRNEDAKRIGFAFDWDKREWRQSVPDFEVTELEARAAAANVPIRRVR